MNWVPSGKSDWPGSIIVPPGGSGVAVAVGAGVAVGGMGVAVGRGVAVGGTGVAVAVGAGVAVGAEVAVGSEPQATTASAANKAIPTKASREMLRNINPPDLSFSNVLCFYCTTLSPALADFYSSVPGFPAVCGRGRVSPVGLAGGGIAIDRGGSGEYTVSARNRRPAAIVGGSDLEPLEVAQLIVEVASDKLAEDIVLLDLRGLAPFADYFVIMSAESSRQIDALEEDLTDSLKESGILRHRREGVPASGWVLLDFSDVIVHIFSPDEREFYALERLWRRAPQVVRVL